MSSTALGMTQDEALEVLRSGRNAFLTGAPGAGKSWLLRKFVTEARKERTVAITASTGIAGTHIGGMTLHSWAGLGVRDEYTAKDIDTIADKAWVANRVRTADVLVIDEVSMLHPQTFRAADLVCRKVRRDRSPFGGLQVVLCGDFFQLPPVSRDGDPGFAFGTESWDELDVAVLYLSTQFRQSDDVLSAVLGGIRAGDVSSDGIDALRGRMHAKLREGIVPTRLHTHNVDVDRVNAEQLAGLRGKVHRFEMVTSGPKPLVEALRNSCLASPTFELKEGAAVMFVKNNANEGYVNGTLGTVVGFEGEHPKVRTDKGVEIVVEPQSWATEDAKGRKLAQLTQVPLRLAWAISVHKSQGMSLSAAEIDLSRTFVEGLGYVALSRVTTLDGIRLLGMHPRALAVSERALAIDVELRRRCEEVKAAPMGIRAKAAAPPPEDDIEALRLFF